MTINPGRFLSWVIIFYCRQSGIDDTAMELQNSPEAADNEFTRPIRRNPRRRMFGLDVIGCPTGKKTKTQRELLFSGDNSVVIVYQSTISGGWLSTKPWKTRNAPPPFIKPFHVGINRIAHGSCLYWGRKPPSAARASVLSSVNP